MANGKQEKLRSLENEMMQNTALPLRESNLVFGEGNPDCTVMFIGEGPGFHENRLRRPFVGLAGQLLDELIRSVGWKRADVYITNVVKRRPPANRDPLPTEIEMYAPYLARQIEIIDPPVIAPLGRFAMNFFLPAAKMSRDQGKVFLVHSRNIVPLYHPAAALRSAAVKDELRRSFGKLPDIVSGKSAPAVLETMPMAKKPQPPKQSSLF